MNDVFDYGLEYLGLGKTENPVHDLKAYARSVITASGVFFNAGSKGLVDVSNRLLKFESDILSPVAENNLVWGRYVNLGVKKPLVMVLGHWDAQHKDYIKFTNILNLLGFSTLYLSLPYHDERRPEHMNSAYPICSANIGETIQSLRQAVCDVRKALNWLESEGHRDIRLVGVSLGSLVGSLAASHDERIGNACFTFLGLSVYDFISTSAMAVSVKANLQKSITTPDLQAIWDAISPQTYFHRLQHRDIRHRLIYGHYDRILVPETARGVIECYRGFNIDHDFKFYGCGHFTIISLSFNILWTYHIIEALRVKSRDRFSVKAGV